MAKYINVTNRADFLCEEYLLPPSPSIWILNSCLMRVRDTNISLYLTIEVRLEVSSYSILYQNSENYIS